MKEYHGKTVYKGIAMGPALVLHNKDQQVKRTKIEDAEAELARLEQAKQKSKEQLQRLYEKALKEVGESNAAIFEVHQMMLDDLDYLESIENMIRTEMINAEYAVALTGDNFSQMFAAMEDDYMRARAADVKDISERLVRNLLGYEDTDFSQIPPSVIVAEDLSPSETVQMDKKKILAFVTVHGSSNSHTSILARMMNIPALIGGYEMISGHRRKMASELAGKETMPCIVRNLSDSVSENVPIEKQLLLVWIWRQGRVVCLLCVLVCRPERLYSEWGHSEIFSLFGRCEVV